jgi:transcriptional regulator with XRE-family HTH domain
MSMPARAIPEIPFNQPSPAFGGRLRSWRHRRRLSQEELAMDAEISTRHLSYVETGRAHPSRDMVLRLAARLEVPLRERNAFLLEAGYAPIYRESDLNDPAFAVAKQAVELILRSHEPFPALAVDRHWNLVAANAMVGHLLVGVHASLLQPPINVLRLSLDPLGLASNIVNLAQWREHLFERLSHQIAATADPALVSLLAELRRLPIPDNEQKEHVPGEHVGIAVPLKFRSPVGMLSFISTTTVFGSPADITLQELALETFFPLDEFTRKHCSSPLPQGA